MTCFIYLGDKLSVKRKNKVKREVSGFILMLGVQLNGILHNFERGGMVITNILICNIEFYSYRVTNYYECLIKEPRNITIYRTSFMVTYYWKTSKANFEIFGRNFSE